MAKVLLKLDGEVIREYSLKSDTTTVGRKTDNDIVINNPAVSGHHCVIEKKGGVYTIEDLGSTNGTSVNDKMVRKVGLHHEDVVGVAKHSLVFLEDAPPAAEPKEAAETPKPAKIAAEPAPAAENGRVGVLKVLKGGELNKIFTIEGNSVYIGKSDRAQIPIEGSGLFGSAPEVAASVHRKNDGFVLVAVEDGYPVVAGSKVNGRVDLNDGDIIECGATALQFNLKSK